MKRSHWLFSRSKDLTFLFAPVWLTWIMAFVLPVSYLEADIPIWVWVVFVLCIDVGHVWTTIFRTYADREEFNLHRNLLTIAPLVAFTLAFALAFFSIDLFWRCLAYVAVFHFVKQQYGFMKIYKARSGDFYKRLISDETAIYVSMLYPIIYWHLHTDRQFQWFVEGDFIQYQLSATGTYLIHLVGNILYFLVLSFWVLEGLYLRYKTNQTLSVGKLIWVLTTAGNWYLGIVFFNSDLVFTITNVVAHGIPYFALIIFYQKKKIALKKAPGRSSVEIALSIVAIVLAMAFAEEFLWDWLVYQEEGGIFQAMVSTPFPAVNHYLKVLALALLSVPQITHYIVDGFIWKNNATNPYVKPILLS